MNQELKSQLLYCLTLVKDRISMSYPHFELEPGKTELQNLIDLIEEISRLK